MNCEEARKRIYPLLDDELETETNIEVLSHLNVCDRCQEKFEAERNFLNELSDALTDREAPEDVREDLRRRLENARETREKQSWFARGKRWSNLMSAAVFLLLVITAGLLSNYFPLHRGRTSEQVVRTFPEYHREVVDRNRETFNEQIKSGTFKSLGEIKSTLMKQFPAFRDQLQVPSLKENQCEVLDAETLPSERSSFGSPNFHVIYCYMGEKIPANKKHEGVMLVGVKKTNINLDRVSDLERVDGTDGFYINKGQGWRTHCVFWQKDSFLMAMITDGLARDHLIELAGSARKEMTSINESTGTSGSDRD